MTDLATRLVDAAKPFVGVAARDLLSDVASRLLGKPLDAVNEDDVGTLAYWTRIGVIKQQLLAEDRAEELALALRATLSETTSPAPSPGRLAGLLGGLGNR